MRLADLIFKIEKRVPLCWAEEWDNPGLTVGDPDSDVSRVAIALDVTEDTVRQAALAGCGLLVSHHPTIFRALKKLIFKTPGPRAIAIAIQKQVALYAAHTNWDSSGEGVNFCLADSLGLDDITPLVPPPLDNGAWGLGAVGNLRGGMNLLDCMKLAKERWRLSSCAGFGDETRPIQRVAVGGGACGDFWPQALTAGADVFITSDIPYHHRNDALSMGLRLIAVDHGEMERVSLAALRGLIEAETGLETVLLQEMPIRRLDV